MCSVKTGGTVSAPEVGRQLRGLRTASGRTVASVAADAGLSVPYIANLENGRGNPTATALTRLAGALGTRLVITLGPGEGSGAAGEPVPPEVPASLVRLGRTARFRQAVADMATALGLDADEFSARLVAALAALAQAAGRDLAEPDWWRLLDALLLIAAHPASPLPAEGLTQLVAAGYPQLGVDALQMVLHRPRREVQPGRDLLVARAGRGQSGYLALAAGQPLGFGTAGKAGRANLA